MNAKLFELAWRWLPKVPVNIAIAVSHLIADVVWLMNPPPVRQLKANYQSLSGKQPSRRLVREGVRSYFRAYAQQLTLPGWTKQQIRQSCVYPGAAHTRRLMEDGPVILALTHSGNWDLAGAWFCQEYGPILTVAEKLEPEEMFNQFVDFRESLGMEIIGVGKDDHIFDELVEKTRGRGLLVPLLADRDIAGSGIEVELGKSKALVAAGPAALALKLNRPLIAGHISYRKVGRNWQIHAHFTDPIEKPEPKPGETQVEAWTKEWVRRVTPAMDEHLVDWHMMQKLFVADLDPERLARAKARHKARPTDGNDPEVD